MIEMRRHEEARTLARANRIEAVVRLCSGKVDTWKDFLRNTEAEDLVRQERRRLRLESATAGSRAKKLVEGFNAFFFDGATEAVYESLFNEIKAGIPLGLRMPICEFEKGFVPLRREVDKGRDQGRPFHATISITLLGLKYEYPEWHFANDIATALAEARELDRELKPFSAADELDRSLKRKWLEAEPLARRQKALLRWCITACFSLLEAYLGGLAWRVQEAEGERLSQVSAKDRKTIEDAGPPFQDRIIRIPRIVSNRSLWEESDPDVQAIITLKHIRDALMHPSPFSVPEKYGGKDKLAAIYDLQHEVVERCVRDTFTGLKRIFSHINGEAASLPLWMAGLGALVDGSGSESKPANKSL
jgi:hypothetical protein